MVCYIQIVERMRIGWKLVRVLSLSISQRFFKGLVEDQLKKAVSLWIETSCIVFFLTRRRMTNTHLTRFLSLSFSSFHVCVYYNITRKVITPYNKLIDSTEDQRCYIFKNEAKQRTRIQATCSSMVHRRCRESETD